MASSGLFPTSRASVKTVFCNPWPVLLECRVSIKLSLHFDSNNSLELLVADVLMQFLMCYAVYTGN